MATYPFPSYPEGYLMFLFYFQTRRILSLDTPGALLVTVLPVPLATPHDTLWTWGPRKADSPSVRISDPFTFPPPPPPTSTCQHVLRVCEFVSVVRFGPRIPRGSDITRHLSSSDPPARHMVPSGPAPAGAAGRLLPCCGRARICPGAAGPPSHPGDERGCTSFQIYPLGVFE